MKYISTLLVYCLCSFGFLSESEVKPRLKTKLTDTLTIAAVGDIMLGSAYPSRDLLPADDAEGSFDAVAERLKDADLSFGNLEGVLLDEGQTGKCQQSSSCYAFRMPERYAAHLKNAGFDLLSVANNHSGDFNEKGREQTAKVLSEAGIQFAGFMSHTYALFVKGGVKYGFCAFAPNEGALSLSDYEIAQDLIAGLKRLSDIVIVSFHGGAEGAKYQHINRKRELFCGEDRGNVYEFAHLAIDAGADLVLGHGPHVTRAVDFYKNRFIAYSLGNFCTYGTFSLDGPNGVAPLLEIKLNKQGEFLSAKVTSVKQTKKFRLQIDPAQTAQKLLRSLSQEDFPESGLIINEAGIILPK
ncbi:MAG: CapA family protein [Sphingobacteriaceae bacterium]